MSLPPPVTDDVLISQTLRFKTFLERRSLWKLSYEIWDAETEETAGNATEDDKNRFNSLISTTKPADRETNVTYATLTKQVRLVITSTSFKMNTSITFNTLFFYFPRTLTKLLHRSYLMHCSVRRSRRAFTLQALFRLFISTEIPGRAICYADDTSLCFLLDRTRLYVTSSSL